MAFCRWSGNCSLLVVILLFTARNPPDVSSERPHESLCRRACLAALVRQDGQAGHGLGLLAESRRGPRTGTRLRRHRPDAHEEVAAMERIALGAPGRAGADGRRGLADARRPVAA